MGVLLAFLGRSWRAVVAAGLMLAGAWYFARYVGALRPLEEWFFLDLLRLWGWEALLTLSCCSFGHWLLRRLGADDLPLLERVAQSLVLGFVAFAAALCIAGFLGLLGAPLAVFLPLALLAIGLPASVRLVREVAGSYRQQAPSATAIVAAAFGFVCVGVLYLGVLSPDAVNYDAGWVHLVIAQDFAREGRIIGFPGDWAKNLPLLGSVVNTWAFLVPGYEEPALRWMQALHNEFTVFLWTLLGVAAGARYLAERAALKSAWAAFFLFPGIFVYDGNMGGAADHFLALFAVPLFLSGVRFANSPGYGQAVVLAIVAAGALLTKVQGVYLLVPVSLLIAQRLVVLAVRNRRQANAELGWRRLLPPLLLGVLVFVGLLSLHFGKNALLFGNPFFPLAQATFPSKLSLPDVKDAQLQIDTLFTDWKSQPPKELWPRLKNALEHVCTFSFVPSYSFVGNIPTFGSLLTLLTPVAFFLPGARRVLVGLLVVTGALFVWAMTYALDRNLQAILPMMVAVTAAIMARVWALGIWSRLALLPLVVVQIAWAGDWYFSGSDRIGGALRLIRSSQSGSKRAARYEGYRREYVALGRAVPADARILLHNQHTMLGIDRTVLLDMFSFQGLIDHRPMKNLHDLDAAYRKLGISHVVWTPGLSPTFDKQAQVLFDLYAAAYLHPKSFGGLRLATLPAQPPPRGAELSVATWRLGGYANGLYQIRDLGVCEWYPPELRRFPSPRVPADAASFDAVLDGADVAIIVETNSLSEASRSLLRRRFTMANAIGGFEVYARAKVEKADE